MYGISPRLASPGILLLEKNIHHVLKLLYSRVFSYLQPNEILIYSLHESRHLFCIVVPPTSKAQGRAEHLLGIQEKFLNFS